MFDTRKALTYFFKTLSVVASWELKVEIYITFDLSFKQMATGLSKRHKSLEEQRRYASQ